MPFRGSAGCSASCSAFACAAGFSSPCAFCRPRGLPVLLVYSYGTDLILPAWTNRRLRHLLVTGAGTRQEWERTPEEEQQLAMSLVLATENAHVPEVMNSSKLSSEHTLPVRSCLVLRSSFAVGSVSLNDAVSLLESPDTAATSTGRTLYTLVEYFFSSHLALVNVMQVVCATNNLSLTR